MVVRAETAFKHMDTDRKGYLIVDDIRAFLKGQNMYPIEKNLQLLYERFDKEEKGAVSQDDLAAAIKPFLTGVNAAE
jgi:Ca2+-binding EF-hand superfamily protein